MARNGLQSHYHPIDGASEKVTISGSNARTVTACPEGCNLVRVYVTTDTHIAFGPDATALADGTDFFLASGTEQYFTARPGMDVAGIQDSAGGFMYVSWMTQI